MRQAKRQKILPRLGGHDVHVQIAGADIGVGPRRPLSMPDGERVDPRADASFAKDRFTVMGYISKKFS